MAATFRGVDCPIVERLVRVESHPDDLSLSHVVAIGPEVGYLTDGASRIIAGGATDDTTESAAVRAIGECVERYCAALLPKSTLRFGTIDDVDGDEGVVRDLIGYADWQYRDPSFPFARFERCQEYAWLVADPVTDTEPIVVPAQLVYLEACSSLKEPTLDLRLSVGLAAGTSVEDATNAGLIEAIERHAASNAWHIQKELTPIDPGVLGSVVETTVHEWAGRGVTAAVFELPCQWSVGVVAAVLIDETGRGPYASIGLGAGFDWARMSEKALHEAAMVRHSCRRMAQLGQTGDTADTRVINGIRDRAMLYADAKSSRSLRRVFPWGGSSTTVSSMRELSNVGVLIKELAADGLNVYRRTVTSEDMYDSAFEVVRVLVPGLRPMDIVQRAPHLRGRCDMGAYPMAPHPFS